MPLLTKDQIQAADDRRFEVVPIAEWGGDVRVRSLSEEEYDDFQDSLYKRRGKNVEMNMRVIRIRLCALSIVDEQGTPLFTENDLKRKSAKAISKVMVVAMRLNGMDDSDLADLAGDETQPKNSGTGGDAGSSSN